MKTTKSLVLAALAFSVACTSGEQAAPELDEAALNAISAESYAEHIRVLSSDEFLGRKPFTKGDTLSVQYIEAQFKALGLEPGNGDSYFQEVPMAEVNSLPVNPKWTFKGPKGSATFNHLDDYVIGTKRLVEEINVDETELVFAGFGIVAPEYNWNDYEGLDAKGKTVVVMVNDPGYYDKTLFKGDTMTYYGRWTYKFEEAARQGATGVLIIHNTGGASYGWSVVRNGWTGPQLNLQTADNGTSRTAFEGWVTGEAADKLFALAGIDEDLIAAAKKPGFKPVPLGIKTAVGLKNSFRKSTSNNVIAKLPGTKRPDEVIIISAHWDHLGTGPAVNGDSIYNGAIDNATGVAALFELAKGFKAAKVQPERSIIFLAVTGEEEGLLGSEYYATNPIYPLNKTVANLNMDSFSPMGRTTDYSVTGLGQSELDEYAIAAAAKQNKTVKDSGNPSAGGFFRSDHFNFVKVGVPALYSGSGSDLIGDSTAIAEIRQKFAGRYHQVTDELDEHWNFEGIMEDIRVVLEVGYKLSMEKTFPSWKPGSEFKELGEKRFTNPNK